MCHVVKLNHFPNFQGKHENKWLKTPWIISFPKRCLHSLKTNISPENRPFAPQKETCQLVFQPPFFSFKEGNLGVVTRKQIPSFCRQHRPCTLLSPETIDLELPHIEISRYDDRDAIGRKDVEVMMNYPPKG